MEIETIDTYTAEYLLKDEPLRSEAQMKALAQLIAASRAGITSMEFDLDLSHLKGIVFHQGRYYLQKNFALEQRCIREWERLTKATPLHPIDLDLFENELINSTLTEEQKHACRAGCRSLVFILTGGPGTGKTYTAGRLIEILQKAAPFHQIALAAPTGKAALNLEKSLRIKASTKTIHALLGIRSNGSYPEPSILPYDLVLIDEASMIDIELMGHLFASIKTGAKLILMGDPYQLPPVDGAPIFPSLVQKAAAKIDLKQCLRAETSDLITFAEEIKLGQTPKINDSVKFLKTENLNTLLSAHLDLFPQSNLPPHEWLEAFQKFRILSPTKIGPTGSIAVNQWISNHLRTRVIPIMITANDYRMGLFNGEVGVLIAEQPNRLEFFSENDHVYFLSGKKIPAPLLPPFELAYAMTVHKSQGSEFEHVLLLAPEGIASLSTPLLYTAVTRARKSITIWTNPCSINLPQRQ